MKLPPPRRLDTQNAEYQRLARAIMRGFPPPPRAQLRTLALGILCGLLALTGILGAVWSVDVIVREAIQQSSRP
jgi:hypothetical protein